MKKISAFYPSSRKLFLSVIILSVSFFTVQAQWPSSPATNVAVSTATSDQWQGFYTKSSIASDGAGGAITCWYNNTSPYEIYAARLNANGAVQWSVTVCGAIGATPRQNPVIISDGMGGAIVAWQDWRDTTPPPIGNSQNIYAARLNGNGAFVWGSGNGTAVATGPAFGNKYYPVMCSDGSNGAIIAWTANISDGGDIFARRVDATGAVSWGGAGGLVICDSTNAQVSPNIVSDGAGGAIIAWEDWRNGSTNRNIFAKRVSATGATVWGGTFGAAVCRATGNQTVPVMVSDAANGAIIAWVDARGGQAVSAQRVDGTGTMIWTANGIAVTNTSGAEDLNIATDGASGAYIVWNTSPGQPSSGGGAQNILGQLVDASGNLPWAAATGIPICTLPGTQWRSNLTATRNGQVIIAWGDYRSGTYSDIYAQKVDNTGAFQWTPSTGVQITSAACSQGAGRLSITGDGCDGAILSWMDRRNDGGCVQNDIYAQNLQSDGSLGGTSGSCPAGLTITGTSSSDESCPGAADGTATVTPSGGVSPYTYKWNTTPQQTTQTATGLTSGSYTVTVSDAQSNTSTATIIVSVSSSVQAGTITGSMVGSDMDSVCQGAAATLSVSGNSGVVQWQSSINGTSFASISGATATSYVATVNQTTYYRVFVGAGLCSDTSPVFTLVVKPLPVSPSLVAADTVICSGDSTQICAPNSFTAFSWNTGETSACIYAKFAGGYWVDVTGANGCSVLSGRVDISTHPVPSVSIIRQGDTLSSMNASSYQWYRNGTAVAGATQAFYIADQPGNYAVEITDANGCKARSSEVVVTGLQEIYAAQFTLFPNPAAEAIHIRFNGNAGAPFYVSLFNEIGAKVMVQNIQPQNGEPLNISLLAPGVYFVHIQSGSQTAVKRFVKM